MIYLYDGSFEGYLTVIFEAYSFLDELEGIEEKTFQLSMMQEDISISTDPMKSERVKRSILANFGGKFYYDFRCVFFANRKNREIIAARLLKKMYKKGAGYFHSMDEDAVIFRDTLKNMEREIHKYLGLVRFDEMEGGILFCQITPYNNVLSFVAAHFQKRMPSEKFIIADLGRNLAYGYAQGRGRLFYYENQLLRHKKRDDEYAQIWKVFYRHISIEQRWNPKLRQNNMPKKYWKNMTEFS